MASLAVGARTNQNNGAADDALNLSAAASAPRLKSRDYLMELAASKDQELAAIDAETQRCRAEMLRAPAKAAAKPPRAAVATPKIAVPKIETPRFCRHGNQRGVLATGCDCGSPVGGASPAVAGGWLELGRDFG